MSLRSENISFHDGWYAEEHDGVRPFRWMQKEAEAEAKGIPEAGKKFLTFTAAHSFPEDQLPVLKVYINNRLAGERCVAAAVSQYLIPFEDGGDVWFSFKLDRTFRVPGDGREFGVMFRDLEVLSEESLETPVHGEGWREWEYDEFIPFRWMGREARMVVPGLAKKGGRYAALAVFSEYADFSQLLRVAAAGAVIAEIPLIYKWNYYDIELPADEGPGQNSAKTSSKISSPLELSFSLNKLFPPKYHRNDPRELGVRVGRLEFHDDGARHEHALFFHRNALLNYREMQEGKTHLDSFAANLGIDLYSKCNIKPPCVYCLWDRMKKLEGEDCDAVVDEKTIEDYGPFFYAARTLVNCSFGEPLLHPRFEQIMELFRRHNKIAEISTNGQAFTPRTVRALVGKPVYLYISLDAATAKTYAKVRNDKWEGIIPSLRLLAEERKKAGNLPKIFMVFMPMRVNQNELEDYFKLCRMIGADSLVLRPLLYLEKPDIRADRGGYHFDYEKELLRREEVEEIFKQCDRFSKKYGVPVANQFNFGIIKAPGTEGEG